MSDIPIIMSAPMIRALLDGRKTMTRRLAWREIKAMLIEDRVAPSRWQQVKPEDRLWVREAWRAPIHLDRMPPRDLPPFTRIYFDADRPWDGSGRHRASFHMPRWASRLTLIITAVKIERLQDISEEDAEAEGCEYEIWDQALAVRNYTKPDGWFCMWGGDDCYSEPGVYVPSDRIWQASFQSLWTSLHGPDSWSTNPEVVVLSFNIVKANIDSPEARAA